MQKEFYSNGKLLLTGEYAVLDGAKALAIPTKYGQNLVVEESNSGQLIWNSYDHEKNCWFEALYSLTSIKIISCSDDEIANTLQNILLVAKRINNSFLSHTSGLLVTTELTFPKDWGLGTSSTLINNIADWAQIDPYVLLEHSFGGSGYDLACAKYNSPIVYHLENGKPNVKEVPFDPSFNQALFFVYLNKKQNSREAIKNYRRRDFETSALIKIISTLTLKIRIARTLSEFEILLKEHEATLSKVLQVQTVQEALFSDYFGTVKSLGGWGGDFVLATGNEKTPEYFKSKGFDIVIPYVDMVL